MFEETEDYNMYVKKKLIQWRNNYEKDNNVTLNYSAIADTLRKHFRIQTSTQKISAMFNEMDKREIKLKELVAISQIFDIPLWDICQYPQNVDSGINTYNLTKRAKINSSSIRELNNKYYFTNEGEYYYCYYFRPKHYQNRLKPVQSLSIEESKMSIFHQDGHTMIKLEEIKNNTTFFGEKMPSFILSGKLYLFENTDMAYSFISDPSGRRAMAIMFRFLNLSADIRYYIAAGMMTFSLNETHEPLFQKMAIFRVQQDYCDPKTEEILRGILALNTAPLIIDEETKNTLEQNEIMKTILSTAKHSGLYHVYNEAILHDSFLIPDDYQRMQLILQLRGKSLLSAHELISEPQSFADFIKDYQLHNLQKYNDKKR